MPLTNADLAQQVTSLISRWDTYTRQLRDWLAGTPDGGPYGDGRYPLQNSLGQVFYVPCPAAQSAMVEGNAASAESFATQAATHALAAAGAKAAAEAARDLTLTYRDAAQAAKAMAEYASSEAQTAEANARYWAQQAQGTAESIDAVASEIADTADAVGADRVAAEAARVAAEAAQAAAELAAQQAATFDPAAFAPVDHSHTIGQITGLQAALDGKAAASHTHGIDQITGLQDALDGKQPAGSYAAAAHTHSASDITSGTLSDARLPSTMGGKTFTSPIVAPGVAIGDQQGYLYQSNSTGSLSFRVGTAGNEKWFALSDDGRFIAHSGGASFGGDVVAAGRVTASEFASSGGNPGPKYFVGDDAALHDVNLPHTIGVAGIQSPEYGYIKFGTAPGVIGWNGTTHIVETDLRVYGAVQGVRMLGGDVATNTSNPVCGGRNGQSNWYAAGLESFCTDGGWAVITLHRSGYSHVNLIHDGNESLYIGTDGNIGGVQLRANGEVWLGDANNRLYRRRQPRIFVQAGDPGAAAADGDLWIW